MFQVNQRKQRDFDDLESVSDVIEILKTQFSRRKLFIRYAVEKTEININEINDDGTIMVVTSPDYQPEGGTLSIYGLSDKYLEVDLKILDDLGPGYYRCEIICGRRAVEGRRDIRFKVKEDQVVATNFRISKHTIDVSGFKMPTSIKVVLDQFQTSNSKMSDLVKVDVLKTDDKDFIRKAIRRTGKTLFISDTSDAETYKAENDDFLDMKEMLGNELPKYMKFYTQKGYKSIIIVPIIYLTEDERSIPFAYIQLISKSENFDIIKVLEIKDHAFKLIDRIRNANTIMVPVHQFFVDISRGGAKLKITDKELQKYIIKARGFIFDIVFKLQAPITIYGEVKATYNDSGVLYVGVDFEGNTSRKDQMKRFYSIIKPMESDYKSRLIKSLKGK